MAPVFPISEPPTPSSYSFPTTLSPVPPLSPGNDDLFAPPETPEEVEISETRDISQEDQPIGSLVEAERLLEEVGFVDSENGEIDTKRDVERAVNENAKKDAKANARKAAKANAEKNAKENAKRAAEKNAARAAKENAKRAPQNKSAKNAKKNAKRAAKRKAERKAKRDVKGDAPLSPALPPPETPGDSRDSRDSRDSEGPPTQTAVEESAAPVFLRNRLGIRGVFRRTRNSRSPVPPPPLLFPSPPFPPSPLLLSSPPLPPSPPLPLRSESPSRTPVVGDPVVVDPVAPELPPPALPRDDVRAPTSKSPQFVDPNYRPFKQKVSAAEQEWQRRKGANEAGSTNEAIDKLMRLVGLEEVKEQALAISAKVEICKLQETDLKDERFHIVFQGNPGTGEIK